MEKILIILFVVFIILYAISPVLGAIFAFIVIAGFIFLLIMSFSSKYKSSNNAGSNSKDESYSNCLNTKKIRNQNSSDEYCIYSKISGVTYDGRQKYIKRLHEGDFIALIREPDNKYDSNAIKCINNGNLLGYINKDIAKDLSPIIDRGENVFGEVKEVTGGNGLSYGCNIKITFE